MGENVALDIWIGAAAFMAGWLAAIFVAARSVGSDDAKSHDRCDREIRRLERQNAFLSRIVSKNLNVAPLDDDPDAPHTRLATTERRNETPEEKADIMGWKQKV